ncbi:hypothetical protein GCM10022237_04930 [Nocardioides ginsengisoli]|uniref:SAF domain-containing protein n=1 Tax=Nocardioides ginsengisoli TaxID=363868 RepID=A0ABW3VWH8_9ACTN
MPTDPGSPRSPLAQRVTRPAWRDPRLWCGVLLVTGSVVLGARLLAEVDETVPVWAVEHARGAGTPVAPDDLVVERVRFADGATRGRYFAADRPLPDGLVLTRPVGGGELLARSAVGAADATPTLRVPIEVDPQRVPPDVAAGSVVDVWVTAAAPDERAPAERPALSAVTVVAAPPYDDAFAVSGTRQLVVAVDDERAAAFERLLAGLADPVVRVLQRS